ncbi:MAG: LemA family protein, partial [Vagococcus fluvialis]
MKNNKVLLIVVGLLAAIVIYGFTAYNGLVSKEAEVESQWATVESKLQRRYDLIPNLVNSVQGSMEQEKEVFGN